MGLWLALVGLSRVDAGGTPISACPFTINQPGDYFLASDLVDCAGAAIAVNASNVRLMMGGFEIRGASGNGIHVKNASRVRIEGPGRIRSAVYGIVLDNADFSEIRDVRARGNNRGIVLENGSDNNQIEGSEVTDNRTDGISLTASTNNKLRNNAVNGNVCSAFLSVPQRPTTSSNATRRRGTGSWTCTMKAFPRASARGPAMPSGPTTRLAQHRGQGQGASGSTHAMCAGSACHAGRPSSRSSNLPATPLLQALPALRVLRALLAPQVPLARQAC